MHTHAIIGGAAALLAAFAGTAQAVNTRTASVEVTQKARATPSAIEYYPMANAPLGAALPFSEAVRVGDMLYLSGQIGTDASGKLVGGGIGAQARQTMDNIGASLARHGSSFDRVIQCTVALSDIADWPAFNAVYRGYFTQHFPARMAYASSGLAMGARVEVQCNAVTAAH